MFVYFGIFVYIAGIDNETVVSLSKSQPWLLIEVSYQDLEFFVQVGDLKPIDELAAAIISGEIIPEESNTDQSMQGDSEKYFLGKHDIQ